MMQPNWFDTEYNQKMEKMTADQVLATIAKDPKIVKAVADAIAEHDKHPTRPGPSRTQVIRGALGEVIGEPAA